MAPFQAPHAEKGFFLVSTSLWVSQCPTPFFLSGREAPRVSGVIIRLKIMNKIIAHYQSPFASGRRCAESSRAFLGTSPAIARSGQLCWLLLRWSSHAFCAVVPLLSSLCYQWLRSCLASVSPRPERGGGVLAREASLPSLQRSLATS